MFCFCVQFLFAYLSTSCTEVICEPNVPSSSNDNGDDESKSSSSSKKSDFFGDGDNGGSSDDSMVVALINRAWPYLAELGMGGIFGWTAGVAAKKVTMQVAYMIGVAFIGLQALSYYGYISISWRKVQSDLYSVVDQNNDGKVDAKDLIAFWKNFQTMMTTNLPSSSGFAAGFLLGFKNTQG